MVRLVVPLPLLLMFKGSQCCQLYIFHPKIITLAYCIKRLKLSSSRIKNPSRTNIWLNSMAFFENDFRLKIPQVGNTEGKDVYLQFRSYFFINFLPNFFLNLWMRSYQISRKSQRCGGRLISAKVNTIFLRLEIRMLQYNLRKKGARIYPAKINTKALALISSSDILPWLSEASIINCKESIGFSPVKKPIRKLCSSFRNNIFFHFTVFEAHFPPFL